MVLSRKTYILRVKCPDDDSWHDFRLYDRAYKYAELRDEDPDVMDLVEQGCSLAFYEVDGSGKKKQLWHRRGKGVSSKSLIELRVTRIIESILPSIMTPITTAMSKSIEAMSKQYEALIELLTEKLKEMSSERPSISDMLAEIVYTLELGRKLADLFGGGERSGGGLDELIRAIGVLRGIVPPAGQGGGAGAGSKAGAQVKGGDGVPEEYRKAAEELLNEAKKKTVEDIAPCKLMEEC